MRKRNSGLASVRGVLVGLLALAGCATPQYTVRQAPVPDESASALTIERRISAVQGRQFEEQEARPIGRTERPQGFAVQGVVDRLSRVTERAALPYRAYLYPDDDPNAAALADGRIYVSTGLLAYLAGRGGREEELAFILGHELAHTVAQHLVKRYRTLQQQQALMSVVAAGAAVITQDAGGGVQQAGEWALNAASLLRDVANSGFSQDQELEADQLGIRYVMRAGYNPTGVLALLRDFERFESPWPFLRTHPYIAQRRADLARYLREIGQLGPAASDPSPPAGATKGREAQRRRLREIQRLYPEGSVSWSNLQRQLDAL